MTVKKYNLDEATALVRVNKGLLVEVKAVAALRGVSQSRFLNEAILMWLNEEFVRNVGESLGTKRVASRPGKKGELKKV